MGTALARNIGIAIARKAQRHVPLPPPPPPVTVIPFGGGSGPPPRTPRTPQQYVPPVPQYMIGVHANVVPPSSKGAIKDAD
jgi:hypothetical protein